MHDFQHPRRWQGNELEHMPQPLHILLVEDSEDDAILLLRELEHGGFTPECLRVQTGREFTTALADQDWDIVIADYHLPTFDAIEALRLLQESKIDLPFVIVSGAIGEEVAVSAMKSGAHDYILKHSLARLVPAVERELREARVRRERKHAQEEFTRLAAIVESSGDAIIGKTLDGMITTWNHGAERLFGYTADEAIGRPLAILIPPEHAEEGARIRERLQRGGIIDHFETVRLHKDGHRIDVSVTISPIYDRDGKITGASMIARDITERRRAETSLAALSKLGKSLATAGTPVEAARVIGSVADELFGWDAFTLDSYFETEDRMQTVLNVDLVDGRKQDVPATNPDGAPSAVARRVIEAGAELILRDEPGGMLPGTIPIGDVSRASASLMFVPIRNDARVIGVMSVQSYRMRAFDARSLRTLQTLADYCGGALERIGAREELRASREQLRAFAAHLQSVREEERKLMTREIHDELGQALTGFKMDLVWIRNRILSEDWDSINKPILDKIRTMGVLLDNTANLMRKLCTELRPGVLDDLGLIPALEWQAREYQLRTGIECELKLNLGEFEVDPDRSTALFRIFQEILTNVARHARAKRVEVSLQKSGPNILLEVKDDGVGIKNSQIAGAKSLGLLGMRERAVILGGEVDIRGAPGKGTTVRVKVPFPEPKAGLASVPETGKLNLAGIGAPKPSARQKRKTIKRKAKT
jgi:PAS domain S-box-containing protein